MTPEEVADSKELPLAAVLEAIEYCQTDQELLQQEADAERRSPPQSDCPWDERREFPIPS